MIIKRTLNKSLTNMDYNFPFSRLVKQGTQYFATGRTSSRFKLISPPHSSQMPYVLFTFLEKDFFEFYNGFFIQIFFLIGGSFNLSLSFFLLLFRHRFLNQYFLLFENQFWGRLSKALPNHRIFLQFPGRYVPPHLHNPSKPIFPSLFLPAQGAESHPFW